MAAIVQFFVNDTSPAISYSPFGDTLSTPNASAGWNPYYSESGFATAQGVQGVGSSYHITSLDGASFTLAWIGEPPTTAFHDPSMLTVAAGSGIQLQGNVTNANFTISLDGTNLAEPAADISDNILATITGLPNAPHAVTLVAQIPESDPSSSIVFERAIIASTPPNFNSSTCVYILVFWPQADVCSVVNSLYELNYLNDSDVAFLGRWSFASDGNSSWHESRSVGDRATTSFRGAQTLPFHRAHK